MNYTDPSSQLGIEAYSPILEGEECDGIGVDPAQFNSMTKADLKPSIIAVCTKDLIVFFSVIALLAACAPPAPGSVPVPGPDKTNNCGALLGAAQELAKKIEANPLSIIAVDVTHIDNPEELAVDIRDQCHIPGAANIGNVFESITHRVIYMTVPHEPTADDSHSLMPVFGVVAKNSVNSEGQVAMQLVDASASNIAVRRNSNGDIVLTLREACLDNGQVAGCSDSVIEIIAQGGDSSQLIFKIQGKIQMEPQTLEAVTMSMEELISLPGGEGLNILVQAQLEKEKDLQNFDQLAGVGAKITEIAGSSGDVGGEAGAAFAPDAAFSQSLNDQGFWLVTETGRLNVAMDGLQVVNATDYIYDSEDPRQIYALEKADGQAVVHTENGVNFVYYGVIEDGVFVIQEKQIIALPDMGLPGVEAGTLIAKDPLAIPEDLRAGLDLQPGTVLIGLTGRGADGSGQAFDLAPSVFKIGDTVLVFQNADGSLTITVSGEDGDRAYTLHVDPKALAPDSGVSVELAGNPFSGMDIFLEEADYWHNPHISQKDGDLGPMGQYVIELFTAGLIRSPQFAEGAMRLGTNDNGNHNLFVNDSDSLMVKNHGWQSMIEANYDDYLEKTWKDQNKRPVIPNGFPDKDGLGVWLPQIWLQQDNTYGVVWYLIPQSWFNGGISMSNEDIIRRYTEYDPMDQGGNALPVPIDFSKIDYCLEITAMPELEAACADMVANRAGRRAAVTTMVKGGIIPEKIRNGEWWFFASRKRIVRP